MKNCKLFFTISVCCWGCGAPYFGSNPDPAFLTGAVNNCKAQPIQQNVIGTWKFVSKPDNRTGTITFNTGNTLSDPDSLFENHLDGFSGPVLSKLYSVETDSVGFQKKYGELFWVRQYTKFSDGSIRFAQGHIYKVITNECKKIELKVPENTTGVILTR